MDTDGNRGQNEPPLVYRTLQREKGTDLFISCYHPVQNAFELNSHPEENKKIRK